MKPYTLLIVFLLSACTNYHHNRVKVGSFKAWHFGNNLRLDFTITYFADSTQTGLGAGVEPGLDGAMDSIANIVLVYKDSFDRSCYSDTFTASANDTIKNPVNDLQNFITAYNNRAFSGTETSRPWILAYPATSCKKAKSANLVINFTNGRMLTDSVHTY